MLVLLLTFVYDRFTTETVNNMLRESRFLLLCDHDGRNS